jgi:hypothetical protein
MLDDIAVTPATSSTPPSARRRVNEVRAIAKSDTETRDTYELSRLHREDGTIGQQENLLKIRPQEKLADTGTAPHAYDDQLGVGLFCHRHQVFGRRVSKDQLADFVIDGRFGQLTVDAFELVTIRKDFIGVLVIATQARMYDKETASAKARFRDAVIERCTALGPSDVSDDNVH